MLRRTLLALAALAFANVAQAQAPAAPAAPPAPAAKPNPKVKIETAHGDIVLPTDPQLLQ